MPEVLVCDPIADEGLEILKRATNVTVKTGLKEAELVQEAPKYDALMVRSQTKITRPVIEATHKLQVVGRAGVGVDNIDLPAATERGIIVVNSPAGNTVAVAELTLGMMLALVRRLVPASSSMTQGEWKRSQFTGNQLYGKTLGVIGTGRIGTEVIKRAHSFGMKVLGYDPFLTTARATQLNIEATTTEEILRRSDFITLHVPLTKENKHLINADAIAMMRDGAYIINCSRGGIVDEQALYEALTAGKLGGAGLDVYENEPPKDSPLLQLDNVVLTPHLGASTEEAQVEVAVDVAQQIVDVFSGRPPQSAVNLPPLPAETREFIGPFLPLMEKLGRLQAQVADGRIESVTLSYCGELNDYDTSALTRVFLKGLLQPSFDQVVTYVNAPILAEQRGVAVTETKCHKSEDYANLIETRVTRNDDSHQRVRQVDGTIFNERDPHIVGIQGLRVDVIPQGTLLIIPNTDKPGMIGSVGTILGSAGVNIVGMQVGRRNVGERAVMVISLEEPAPPEVLKQLDAQPDLFGARQVDLR
ncbi:MAG: phosphoglycerate dehydrogenase [Abitibacteriaceae bacterium]|nr:phosphoglycerate dehydrogenase [Abditibacteriaceae bacterium]MBV9868450.1 phosphoglycerate dehydrogenase [Abditibacteriaceae bacterium]